MNTDQLEPSADNHSLLAGPPYAELPPGEPADSAETFAKAAPVEEHLRGTVRFGGQESAVETDGYLAFSAGVGQESLRIERFATGSDEPYEAVTVRFTTEGQFLTSFWAVNLLDRRVALRCSVDGGIPALSAEDEERSFTGGCGDDTDLTGTIRKDRTVRVRWRDEELVAVRTTTTVELTGAVTGRIRETNDIPEERPYALLTSLDMAFEQNGLELEQHLQRWALPRYEEVGG